MKSDTRNHIIQTASDLFYEKGYNLTGINEIIAKADIAKATLYSHFKSKKELAIAYLEAMDNENRKNMEAFVQQRNAGNDRLRAVLAYLIPFFEQDNFNGCWCHRTIAEIPRNNKKIRATIQNSKTFLLNYLIGLVAENRNDLPKEEQNTLARRLYLLYEGALSESHLHGKEWPIKEAIRMLETFL